MGAAMRAMFSWASSTRAMAAQCICSLWRRKMRIGEKPSVGQRLEKLDQIR